MPRLTSKAVRRAAFAGIAVFWFTPGWGAGALPSFPGAEGFGAAAAGGRGGRVLRVTHRGASGPGSLAAACAAPGPRIVVFAVAGVIRGDCVIRHSAITIAGQSAPMPGITLAGRLLVRPEAPRRTYDIVIRHLRFRPPPHQGHDGDVLQIPNSERVMIDHVSLAWGNDEMIDIIQSSDITVQWSTVEESDTAGHGKRIAHNFALLSAYPGSGRVSIHHNLFAHHARRLPALSPAEVDQPGDFRNNVVYNFRDGLTDEGHVPRSPVNLIGNYYKRGPSADRLNLYHLHPRGQYYLKGNFVEGFGELRDRRQSLPRWIRITGDGAVLQTPAPVAYTTTTDAQQAFDEVLRNAGAAPHDRVTRRTIDEVRHGTGAWGRHGPADPDDAWFLERLPAEAPIVDRDGDGMSDVWEQMHGLDPRNAGDHARIMASGYTAVEDYLNQRAVQLMQLRAKK